MVVWNTMRPEGRAILDSLLTEFGRMHGVSCAQVYYEPEELRSNYQIATLGGSGPDLVYGPGDQVGPFSEMELVAPLEQLLSREVVDAFLPEGLVWRRGHLYQLSDQIGNHLHLVYNRALVPQPPRDTDEMIQIARDFTRDEDGDGRMDYYGMAWNFEEPFFFVPFLGGFGGWVMDDEARPTLDTPATVAAFRFMYDLKFTHRILPPESDYDTADALFKEGRAAMIINGPWSWASYLNMGIDMGLALIPKVSATGLWATPMVSTQGYSVNVHLHGERLRMVLNLLTYLTSRDAQLVYARAMKTIPSRLDCMDDPAIADDEMIQLSMEQARVGKPMPVDPELRAIWDTLRPNYQSVLNGTKTPEQAAQDAQRAAEKAIEEMNR
ncbi:extracellular solute-binding protein [Candidatus Fermentibacteria bacterium]|nr:extracellular solute-binding protein [Candidatus Fermentibacteria bacterium]